MRFVDANVFIYAVLNPQKPLPESVVRKKKAAREIFIRINGGEKVIISTVHLSEVANVVEDVAGIDIAADLIATILVKSSIAVEAVTPDLYQESVHRAKLHHISINDALAWILMEKNRINEIYTFDRHFGGLNVKVIQE